MYFKINKRRIKWNEYCCCFPSVLLSEDEPAAFDFRSLCEASQPASSDYNGQIDFFPWRFFITSIEMLIFCVAVATQSVCAQWTAALLWGQLFVLNN